MSPRWNRIFILTLVRNIRITVLKLNWNQWHFYQFSCNININVARIFPSTFLWFLLILDLQQWHSFPSDRSDRYYHLSTVCTGNTCMSKLVGNKIRDYGIIIFLWILVFCNINEQNERLSNVSFDRFEKVNSKIPYLSINTLCYCWSNSKFITEFKGINSKILHSMFKLTQYVIIEMILNLS